MYPYELTSSSASPIEYMMAQDMYAMALATLGPEEQQMVDDYFHEGDIGLKEVAARHCVSKSTVQRYVAAVRKQMVRILQEWDELHLLNNTKARLPTVAARTAGRPSHPADTPPRANEVKHTLYDRG